MFSTSTNNAKILYSWPGFKLCSMIVLFQSSTGWHRPMYQLTPFISTYCPSHICSHFTCVIQQYVRYGFVVSSCIIPEHQDALQRLSTARQEQKWRVCIVLNTIETSADRDKCVLHRPQNYSKGWLTAAAGSEDGHSRLLLVNKLFCKRGNVFYALFAISAL
jgi:hypothetical protein